LSLIKVGGWREDSGEPMQVVSGPIGRERVRYEAPPAARVAGEMKKFLAWFAMPGDADPLLVAGLAHLWFVTIHPLDAGNGRIARAIADMALARSEGTRLRFYSRRCAPQEEQKPRRLQLNATAEAWLRRAGIVNGLLELMRGL
jgi:Fic family protein